MLRSPIVLTLRREPGPGPVEQLRVSESVSAQLLRNFHMARRQTESRPEALAGFPEKWHDHQILPKVDSLDWKQIQSAFDAKLFRRGDKDKIAEYFGVHKSSISRRLAEGVTLRADSQNTTSAFLPEAFLATSRLPTQWTSPGHTPKINSEDWKAVAAFLGRKPRAPRGPDSDIGKFAAYFGVSSNAIVMRLNTTPAAPAPLDPNHRASGPPGPLPPAAAVGGAAAADDRQRQPLSARYVDTHPEDVRAGRYPPNRYFEGDCRARAGTLMTGASPPDLRMDPTPGLLVYPSNNREQLEAESVRGEAIATNGAEWAKLGLGIFELPDLEDVLRDTSLPDAQQDTVFHGDFGFLDHLAHGEVLPKYPKGKAAQSSFKLDGTDSILITREGLRVDTNRRMRSAAKSDAVHALAEKIFPLVIGRMPEKVLQYDAEHRTYKRDHASAIATMEAALRQPFHIDSYK